MVEFHIIFTSLVILTTSFLLVQTVLNSKLEFTIIKNKYWFRDQSIGSYRPKVIGDLIVASAIALIFFSVSWFELLSVSQKKIDTTFTSLASLYFFFRMYSYSFNLQKKIPKQKKNDSDFVSLEKRSIFDFISKPIVYSIVICSSLGLIGLIIKSFFFQGSVAAPIIFVVIYGICFFVIRVLLLDRRHGEKEIFEKLRNMVITYVVIFCSIIGIASFLIILDGCLIDLPDRRASIKYFVRATFMIITLSAYFKLDSKSLYKKIS